MRRTKEKSKGWVEVDKNGKIFWGRLGLKVWRVKKEILAAGFASDEVARVEIVKL